MPCAMALCPVVPVACAASQGFWHDMIFDCMSPLVDSLRVCVCRIRYMTSELFPAGPKTLDGQQKIAAVARVWLSYKIHWLSL